MGIMVSVHLQCLIQTIMCKNMSGDVVTDGSRAREGLNVTEGFRLR